MQQQQPKSIKERKIVTFFILFAFNQRKSRVKIPKTINYNQKGFLSILKFDPYNVDPSFVIKIKNYIYKCKQQNGIKKFAFPFTASSSNK